MEETKWDMLGTGTVDMKPGRDDWVIRMRWGRRTGEKGEKMHEGVRKGEWGWKGVEEEGMARVGRARRGSDG